MIKAIAFDWGNTIMREIPLYRRPSAHSPKVEVVPGVTEALRELHRSYTCCVASNARGPEATTLALVLEHAALDKYVTHVFTAHDLGAEKPSPQFFQEMLRRLKLQPHECIMVGDDYRTDIQGAKAAGLRTIWFSEASNRDTRDADSVVRSPAELVPAVARLAAQGQHVAT